MHVMGIIFANDGDLGDLTDHRTTAAVPFAGRYRQIDFHLSNMASAGIHHIGIISRHNYQSLMHHIGSGEEWGLELGEGGLEFLTPYSMSTTDHYNGKLETLYFAMNFLEYGPEDEYVVMSGSSILSNLNVKKLLESHVASGRDVTVVAKAGIANGTKRLDLAMKLDDKGEISDMAVDYVAPADYLASMDIFVLSKKLLIRQVKECVARNLYHMDRNLVLGNWQRKNLSVNVYQHEGVALYNESLPEYFSNSLKLIHPEVRHDLFGRDHDVFTKVRDRVPSYYGENCSVSNSIVADGCMLEGNVSNSVLFRQVTVAEGASVEASLVMNDAVIGEGAELKYAIIDKNVEVRSGAKVIGTLNSPMVIKRGDIV